MPENTNQSELLVLTLSIAIFFLIIALMVMLRVRTGEKFGVRSADILLAFIPIAMWMVFSGQVKVIEFAGFRIETAFVNALGEEVKNQAELPVEEIARDEKAGTQKIRQFIKDKKEALTFYLGRGYYIGSVTEDYLNKLTKYPFFKYVVINDQDGKFFGLIDAALLQTTLSQPAYNKADFEDFVEWVNQSDHTALSDLPGFIGRERAIRKDAEKQTALEEMEEWNIDTLPVLNEEGGFFGVVNRTHLTSSLILEVAKKVR